MSTTSTPKTVNGVLWLGTQALGLGLILFSAPAVLAPRFFGRLAGLPMSADPASSVAIRSVAVRDVVMGVGLISAARHHARLKPWLLTRTLCDGGDSAAIALAFLSGAGNRRLGWLGAVAFAATLYDAALYVAAKREEG